MASNAEMRRLVTHAADRLGQEAARSPYSEALAKTGSREEDAAILQDALSLSAALALAEATLRMVAACLDDDEPGDFFVDARADT